MDGIPIDIKGVSWFGFEGQGGVVDGLWVRPMTDYLTFLQQHGFNAIRIPLAVDNIAANALVCLSPACLSYFLRLYMLAYYWFCRPSLDRTCRDAEARACTLSHLPASPNPSSIVHPCSALDLFYYELVVPRLKAFRCVVQSIDPL